jgi:integrase
MGSLYQRKLRDGSPGPTWWCKYYVAGQPKRESTGTTKRKATEAFLKTREGCVAAGMPVLPRADRVRYEEIAKDLRTHYESSGNRNPEEAEFRPKHLDPFFRGRRVAEIGGAEIDAYVAQRQQKQAANGTINRELATLSRMLRLAYENQKLLRLPVIRRPKEAAPRAGFFEDVQFQAVRRLLPEDLQVAVTIMFTYGWRKAEVLMLERRQLDLKAGTLRLDTSKNGEPRTVCLTPELKAMLGAQVERVDRLSRKIGRIIAPLFPHPRWRRAGEPRRGFRKRWRSVCKKAGVPGRLLHDFRRTAVRNLERRGVPRSVAMKLTGHRTEAVYRRYAIVSDADLQDAAKRLAGTF